MKKIFLFVSIVMLSSIIYLGCQENTLDPNDNLSKPGDPVITVFTVPTGDNGPATYQNGVTYCGTSKVVDIFAGQTIDVGGATIYNDGTNLYVTVTLVGDWGFDATKTEQLKMWIGADLANLPKTPSGNPQKGHFPYKVTYSAGQTYTFTIPLNGLSLVNNCGDQIYIVLHLDVRNGTQNETAFAGDLGGNSGNSWWYYTTYTIQCCDNQTFDHSGTAFAKGGWVFTTDNKSNPESLPSLRLIKNRWGWAINLTSPTTTPITYEIWADAGLNKTENGTMVGTLTVSWNGTQVTLDYDLVDNKYIQEVHVYAGDFRPTTTAPGQYGFNQYFDPAVNVTPTYTFDVSDTNSDGIWIIAHAVVCW